MTVLEQRQPSRWRWAWAFLFVFLAHVALVFWSNERSHPVLAPEKVQPLIYLPTDAASAQKVAALTEGADPTLFALPNNYTFSGNAWLRFTPAELSSSNWSAGPSWLPLRAADLGAAVTQVSATNRVSADRLLTDFHSTAPFELRIPAALARSESTFIMEGALHNRPLLWSNSLPNATNSDLVADSHVALAVNGDGVVESVMLLQNDEPGAKSMDNVAVKIARGLRFAPVPGPRRVRELAPRQRGIVTFRWRAVAPVTNALTSTIP